MPKVSFKDLKIIDLMVAINRRYSDIPALQIKEEGKIRSISYIDLGRRTADTAHNLKKLGVERGDRVAILSESRPEWGIAFFGIVSCAGVTVPMDVKLSDAEIEFIVNDSGAKYIFISNKFLERIKRLKPKLEFIQNIICLDDDVKEDVLLLKDFKVPENEITYREITEDDVAVIVYTSGTTGVAKGVELTYKNLLFEVTSLHELINFNDKDEFLSILPLNHMLELTGGFLGPLFAGATVTYCDSLKPTNILSVMNETKSTVMICVPLVLKMFHNSIMNKIDALPKVQRLFVKILLHISRFLLKFHIRVGKFLFRSIHKQFGSGIRGFVSGGAPLDPIVELNFNAMGFRILQGYGLTETSPVITVNNFEECKYGSVGKPLPGVTVKIIPNSDTGGKDGEIVINGPNVMKGYYKSEEKTKEVLKDDWFHTGDIGYFDDDGFLFISGRIRNLIVLGSGKKVFPEEIEEVMSASQYIKEICVLGKVAQQGIRKGCEEVYAVVVPNLDMFDKENRSNKELVRGKINSEILRLGENLAEYKRIMNFDVFYDELPKTSTRKVKRKVLLELISKAEEGSTTEKKEFIETNEIVEDDFTLKLRKIISDTAKVPPEKVTINAALYNDLGIDSLMKVEVLVSIQKEFGISIPDSLSYEINTLGDLIRFAKEYKAGRSGDEVEISKEVDDFIEKSVKFKVTHSITYFIFKSFFKIYFNKSVSGFENIPLNGSFIIAANHTSLLDFPLLMTSLPYDKMKNVFAPAAKDYFYTKKYRKAIMEVFFNTFPFERMGDFMKGLKICETLVKNNCSIILFPEGTRVTSGQLQLFKPGLGSLALNLNVPILPVYIKGALRAMPKGKVFPLPHKIEIKFGKAIYPDKVDLSSLKNNYEKYVYLSKISFDEVVKLREQE